MRTTIQLTGLFPTDWWPTLWCRTLGSCPAELPTSSTAPTAQCMAEQSRPTGGREVGETPYPWCPKHPTVGWPPTAHPAADKNTNEERDSVWLAWAMGTGLIIYTGYWSSQSFLQRTCQVLPRLFLNISMGVFREEFLTTSKLYDQPSHRSQENALWNLSAWSTTTYSLVSLASQNH